jgi:hypothetical protein
MLNNKNEESSMSERPFRLRFNPDSGRYEPQRVISADEFWNEYYNLKNYSNDPYAAYDYVIESLLEDIYEENGYFPDAEAIINHIQRNLDKESKKPQ